MALARVRNVTRVYDSDGEPVTALDGVSLEVEPGDFVALMGPSGCGKSTLLHILGAMDRPTSGEAWIAERAIHNLPEEELTMIRRKQVGFVFQFFHLLPTLTVEENVTLPLLLDPDATIDRQRVERLLERVGLAHRRSAVAGKLSGGELQRAAVARAVIHNPALIVADEPTGNLDSENGAIILELLGRMAAEGTAVVMATHSTEAAGYGKRCLRMRDGKLV
jgi:putative ABC transport system ATP-binding protein